MRKSTLILALLAVYLTTTGLQCESKECYGLPAAMKHSNVQLKQLDNRGPKPVELSPGAQGWREAYGLRLLADIDLKNPNDTIGDQCPSYFPEPYPQHLSILTLTGIGAQYPPGSEVTSLFKFVFATEQYRDMEMAAGQLWWDWSNFGPSQTDFLLVKPPETAGWQQFELLISYSDSTTAVIVTDSLYLQ